MRSALAVFGVFAVCVSELMARRRYDDPRESPSGGVLSVSGRFLAAGTVTAFERVFGRMNEQVNPPRRSRRRANRMNELERRVESLESEIRWLRRALDARSEQNGPMAVGACPNCGTGVLMRHGDELRCNTCGYSHFL